MHAGTGLIEYTTAEHLAQVYKQSTDEIREAAAAIHAATSRLNGAFGTQNCYRMSLGFNYESRSTGTDAESVNDIIDGMKLDAWHAILNKLNIFRVMSSKRVKELQDALSGRGSDAAKFPEILPETIQQVAAGYLSSINEFLEEAVTEEYDFWKTHHATGNYKRNSFFRLTPKIIKGWIVEPGYGNSDFRCNYSNQAHVTALDNIFHLLAGQGPVKEHKGPLASEIELSKNGVGQTEFFKFRCYKNRNLHLEFRRIDLLEKFNQIAGRNRLPGRESA